MLSFIYSSWQMMFGSDFTPEMTGQFVMLVREGDYKPVNEHESKISQVKDNGLGNPHKTNVTATFTKTILDGEMVLLDLNTEPPIVAIAKLPCGENLSDFVPGKYYSFSGELQFQKTPQLQFLPGMNIKISDARKVSECEFTEDITAVVSLKNVGTCQ